MEIWQAWRPLSNHNIVVIFVFPYLLQLNLLVGGLLGGLLHLRLGLNSA